ncbi:MAG: PP2C family protein-serine/threonine phosphatase [Acutalibacteraceae bacterium]
MKLVYYALSEKGKIRTENQDRYLTKALNTADRSEKDCPTDFSLTLAVFDGMGGAQQGSKAAQIAKETGESILRQPVVYSLSEMVQIMNTSICDFMQNYHISRMGSTAAILRFVRGRAEICNVGDSRIYKIADGKMYRLSQDHTMIVGKRRVLTQHLGIPLQEMALEPHEQCCKYESGDMFLLCSDGLTDMVSESGILKAFYETPFENVGARLMKKAYAKGGRDNITMILCKVV